MAETPSVRATPGTIVLLTSMVMLGQMSISLYIPSLPSLAETLAAPPEHVKLTMTLYLACFAVSQLVWGPLSDRFGRRPILFAGIAVYLAGTLACAFAPGIGTLILARGLQGIGACVGSTVARAVTRDRFERDEAARTLAYIGIAMAVGPALAPILGGQLQTLFGWRAAFLALSVFGTCVGIATWRRLDETNRHPDPQALSPTRLAGSVTTLLANRVYVGYSLAIAGAFTGLMAYTTGIPFVFIDQFGISPAMFGFVPTFTVMGYVAGSVVASRLAPRGYGANLVAAGSAICLVAGAAFVAVVIAGHANPFTVVAPMVVFMAGFGILTPNAMAHALQPFPRIAGSAAALQGFLQMTVAALGTVGVAALSDGTPLSTALGVSAGGVLAAFGFFVLARPAERHA
ncbi:MAG: multidrug effflux MFS transporter [Proteobacteria bacterium]|nr:multidrug effflux MFS transporter [Pseudomonadota bacterium]